VSGEKFRAFERQRKREVRAQRRSEGRCWDCDEYARHGNTRCVRHYYLHKMNNCAYRVRRRGRAE
jgi:hypothetical protein